VICFPYVGAGSTVYKPLAKALGPRWQVVAVDLPGHGANRASLLDRQSLLLPHLLEHLPADLFEGAVAFGFSLGAYLVHGLACAGVPMRGAVMCAATPYHHIPAMSTIFDGDSDAALMKRLADLGGIPPGLQQDRDLFELFLPVLRADFSVYGSCVAPATRSVVPTLLLAASSDEIAPAHEMLEWDQYLAGDHRQVTLDEGHFFLASGAAKIAAQLNTFADELDAG